MNNVNDDFISLILGLSKVSKILKRKEKVTRKLF